MIWWNGRSCCMSVFLMLLLSVWRVSQTVFCCSCCHTLRVTLLIFSHIDIIKVSLPYASKCSRCSTQESSFATNWTGIDNNPLHWLGTSKEMKINVRLCNFVQLDSHNSNTRHCLVALHSSLVMAVASTNIAAVKLLLLTCFYLEPHHQQRSQIQSGKMGSKLKI